LDVFVSSDADQGEDIGPSGENEPESQADARFPNPAAMKLADSESGLAVRLSHDSLEREQDVEDPRFPVRRQIAHIALKPLGESDLHRF
jgi:hypothetical protein